MQVWCSKQPTTACPAHHYKTPVPDGLDHPRVACFRVARVHHGRQHPVESADAIRTRQEQLLTQIVNCHLLCHSEPGSQREQFEVLLQS